MSGSDLLADAFGRVNEMGHHVLDGLDTHHLTARVDPDANTIAWLLWHVARIQDDHLSGAAGTEQVWIADGWADRFGLPLEVHDTGFAHSADDVATVRAEAALLRAYLDAAHRRTLDLLAGWGEDDCDRIVDESWDPPVTLGVRLVSVLADNLAHVGQAAYVRGILERR